MKKTILITKAISDGNRVRVLMALTHQQELCACHIAELLRVSAPTVSRHMGILLTAGLVTARKDSRWVYYRLTDATGDPDIRPLVRWLAESLKADPDVSRDRLFLGHIAACDSGQINYKSNNNRQTGRNA
ncbi:MAG: metalloregulator ArsR/SmtB family transcription factor [Thermodesulfobacteriota bacterium]